MKKARFIDFTSLLTFPASGNGSHYDKTFESLQGCIGRHHSWAFRDKQRVGKPTTSYWRAWNVILNCFFLNLWIIQFNSQSKPSRKKIELVEYRYISTIQVQEIELLSNELRQLQDSSKLKNRLKLVWKCMSQKKERNWYFAAILGTFLPSLKSHDLLSLNWINTYVCLVLETWNLLVYFLLNYFCFNPSMKNYLNWESFEQNCWMFWNKWLND